jgi:DTW domain-containing protein YfiP
VETCSRCSKPTALCICADLPSIKTRIHVFILQHPQEPKEVVGTAKMAHLALPNSTLKVGLSWPNLAAAVGRKDVQNQRWAVLYLGSGVKVAGPPIEQKPGLVWVDKKGLAKPLTREEFRSLEGLVVLDGTWSQAKALWWRNAWLLKLRRAILIPKAPSAYGKMRKEPRKECLSTIESIAQTLPYLGENPSSEEALTQLFNGFLQKYRARPRT